MRTNNAHRRRKAGNPFPPIKPAILALAISQALAFQAAQAASIEVSSTLDDGTDCTLREAITTINAGTDQLNGCILSGDTLGINDTITFGPAVSGQTIITTQGELSITEDVSINPDGTNTTVDGNQLGSRVMGISNYASVTINQITITGGNANVGGGIFVSSSSLELKNSTVSGNTAYRGGGIELSASAVKLTNTTISGNNATNRGGGIFAHDSQLLTLTNSTVSGNNSVNIGSGIYLVRVNSLLLENTTVTGNTAGSLAGGIRAWQSSATITNSIIADNIALSDPANADCSTAQSGTINAGTDTISSTACDTATIADPLLGH